MDFNNANDSDNSSEVYVFFGAIHIINYYKIASFTCNRNSIIKFANM